MFRHFEDDDALGEREEGVVRAAADVGARVELYFFCMVMRFLGWQR